MRQTLEEQKLLRELEQASLAGTLNSIGRHCQAVTKRWNISANPGRHSAATLFLSPMVTGYPAFVHVSGNGLILREIHVMYRIIGKYEEPISAEGLTVFFDFSSVERLNPGEDFRIELENPTRKDIDVAVTLFLR